MRRISWALVISLILTSGYVALWFSAHSKVQSSIQMWKTAEHEAGRLWSCGKQSLGGFPLQMILICDNPTLESFGSSHIRISADSLQLEAHVFSPTRIYFSVQQRLTLGFPSRAVNLSFERLSGFMKWGGSSGRELNIIGENFLLSLDMDNFSETWTGSTLGSIALRLSEPGMPDASSRTLNVALDIKDVRAAARNVLTLNGGPVDGKLVAQVTHWEPAAKGAYALLERWRMDGGLLRIIEADASSNGAGVGLSGSFRLDELRRIDGEGNVKFSDGLILTNALKSFAGGNFNLALDALKPPLASGARPLLAPITLTSGKVYIGPIDTRLRTYPLYGSGS